MESQSQRVYRPIGNDPARGAAEAVRAAERQDRAERLVQGGSPEIRGDGMGQIAAPRVSARQMSQRDSGASGVNDRRLRGRLAPLGGLGGGNKGIEAFPRWSG